MEQTWYLFPGQTLENTKIKDRGKALIATPAGWKKITDHLDRKKFQQEILDKELASRRYLKEGCEAMTRDWENSIERIRQRRFEEHDQKIKDREENLYKRFRELRQEQHEERAKFVIEAKKRIIMHQEPSRHVNSALLLTEVLYERKLQQEFQAKEQENQDIEAANYAALVTYNAEQEKLENAEKKRKKKETDVKHSEALMQHINEANEAAQKEKEERTKLEIEDHERAAEEFKAIREYEYLLDRKKKAGVKQSTHDFAEERKQIKEAARIQNESENKIVDICAKGKCRIEKMKKIKDKELQEVKEKIRHKLGLKLMAANTGFEEEEERLLTNAQKEYEEKALEMTRKKEAYQHRLREGRLAYRRQVLEERQKAEEDKRELDNWDMVNRLKTDEALKKYEQDKAQRLFNDKIAYRRMLDQQIKDDDTSEYDKKCIEADLQYNKEKWEKDDNEYFTYAGEVLDLAKSRGRPTDLIEKAVHKYKVRNNLEPKKKNISHLNSKVPINNKNK